MAPITITNMKLVGGHPALDFTNTIHSRGAQFGPDLLQSYSDLLDSAVRLGILDEDEAAKLLDLPGPVGDAALARATALREAIYRIMTAKLAADPADVSLLQRETGVALAKRELVTNAGRYEWRWPPRDPDSVTHRLACAATDLLTSDGLDRVHVCPGENCAWLFLDTSKSGRRLWCSEAGCGTRDRVRRWRDRQASKP